MYYYNVPIFTIKDNNKQYWNIYDHYFECEIMKNYNSLINQRKDIGRNYTTCNNKIKLNLKSLH